jgi:hypothetical protein
VRNQASRDGLVTQPGVVIEAGVQEHALRRLIDQTGAHVSGIVQLADRRRHAEVFRDKPWSVDLNRLVEDLLAGCLDENSERRT